MKYVVLSFDDGKKDFYKNTLPILKENRIPAVLNVVSNFANKEEPENEIFVTWEEIKESKENGVEIANHSANHSNDIGEIIRGKEEICRRLDCNGAIGFASPYSAIYKKNFHLYKTILETGCAKYIRSGNQVKRDGKLHLLLYVLYRLTKSKKIFLWYNKRNFIKVGGNMPQFFSSITSNKDNSLNHIIYCLEKMPDEHAAIINFHCIVKSVNEGVDIGKWFNDTDEFKEFCSYLSKKKGLSVITNIELCELFN